MGKETIFEAVKRRMASINFTLLLLLAAFAIHRGVDPCERLFTALTGVGVADVSIQGAGDRADGPPMPRQVVIQLADGQEVRILENGAIRVEGKEPQ
jgi:hypothetical protein